MADETPKGDRIAKVLARAGVASRRDSEKLIEAGRIKVNGRKIFSGSFGFFFNIQDKKI